MSRWILDAVSALDSPHAGGKARALARAGLGGLDVPRWVVVSELACDESRTSRHRADQASDSPPAARTIESVSMPAVVRAEIAAAVLELCPNGELLAVRSSAHEEDGSRLSFAGQLESFLHVAPEDAADRVLAVWRSALSDRVIAYRRRHGLDDVPRPPAVILQRMVAPRAAGVAFSADPVSGRRGVTVVSAMRGSGEALVSGLADADTWRIDRDGGIIERVIARPASPALTDDQVREVARLARSAARQFGCPQDVEWALADRLVLLQSRPITSLHASADPDACLTVWDNSNIVESYSGVTTPLTFSFTREIYPPVYRQFCRMMGVPARTMAHHDDIFLNVLGLVRGRLYYNLLNWYRILALLPGYRLNRRFMEQMMGVGEPLPVHVAEEVRRRSTGGRFVDAVHITRTLAGLLVNVCTIDWRVASFSRRLDTALAPPSPPLEERRPDELVAHYRDLRRRLLLAWDAPIVNDFLAMVFHGLLRRLVTRWCGDPAGTLQNDLLGGRGGLVSAEPAVLMRRLARLAGRSPALVERLATGSAGAIRAELEHHPEFFALYRQYLEKFGDRTVKELELESVPLHEDPLPLFRAIAALGRQMGATRHEAAGGAAPSSDTRRALAYERVSRALAGRPFKRLLFNMVLEHAGRRIRDRENLRLERTRLFARVRQIFLELGRRLHDMDLLDNARDVLYLEVEEVLAFVDGRSTCTDLRGLAALRRREFRGYEDSPAPDSRFEAHGSPYHGCDHRRPTAQVSDAGDERCGLGCSPGIVRGPVRIVNDPRAADLSDRPIVVARHTDPGWILVFPSALGVLVERGSLLSHAAIVARELGVPTVVSLPGVTAWLRDGDWVEMDGGAGIVRRIARPGEPAAVDSGDIRGAVAHA